MSEKTRTITERQWRYLHRKINYLEETLTEIRSNLPKKEKKWLNFNEAVPPASICKDVNSMLDGVTSFEGFVGRLSEFYGCKAMPCQVDTSIDPKYAAVYRPFYETAYTRTQTIHRSIILHEFFHHLVHLKVVVVPKNKEEYYADKYAQTILQRAGFTN